MLPYNSPLRNTAQAHTVSMLFNSLEHPPASYLGHKHQYRTADASHHVRVALFHLICCPSTFQAVLVLAHGSKGTHIT